MLFKEINNIPYPFLHDAAMVISKRYTIKHIYVDPQGELDICLEGYLDKNQIVDVLRNLCTDPNKDFSNFEPIEYVHYSYSEDYALQSETYIYSEDGIDYINL